MKIKAPLTDTPITFAQFLGKCVASGAHSTEDVIPAGHFLLGVSLLPFPTTVFTDADGNKIGFYEF